MAIAETPAPSPSTGTPAEAWTRRRLYTFRTGAVLFAMQIVFALSDASDGTRQVAARASGAVRAAFSAIAPQLVAAAERVAARSDGHAVVLGLARDVGVALVLAALWTLCDRRRRHDRLAGAVRVTLRYLVGVVMCIYGGLKVVPVQFPIPAAEELLRPLGERTPMGLLWAFFGVSPAYTTFAGLGETIGATLLFWRRTTTIGALLLVAVLANVVVVNFAYDVPVKRGASLLLLAAIVLASRDARRLARVLWLDLPTGPGREPAWRGGPWLRRVRAVLKPLIVLLAVAGPIVTAVVAGPRATAGGRLHGIYAVERFVRDGIDVPPLLTETGRWRRVVLGDRGAAVAQTMNDHFERYGLTVDEAARTITLAGTSGQPALRFHYEATAAQTLHLHGDGQSLQEVELRAMPDATVFRVLR
ncbi:MAG TPA: hypothetical protein VFZ65_16800 [Planctomycetota bacterium]|nr:hypothetical protein [Planctomycetota bacterium]